MRPRIVQDEQQIGFYWTDADGRPITLQDLVRIDEEPERLPPTHLEALDDAMIISAERFGEYLGGGRKPTSDAERADLRDLHRSLDRLVHEYSSAVELLDSVRYELRSGQIIGTATLMSVLARQPLGTLGSAPLENDLDTPEIGVVSGFGELVKVDETRPWMGSRWIVRTPEGRRLPATLAMLMFDSSGVFKDAALDEHRAALKVLADASTSPEADPLSVASAVDWMLYDWLMAHRDGPDSGAIEVRTETDAEMIVDTAALSILCRSRFDPELLRLPALA